MKKVKFKSAYILAVGAAVALSATIMNSCSSDDDYDIYQGDELKTYAATTRATGESGDGDSDIYYYVYSFRCNGPRYIVQTISEVEGFYATVTFDWINTGEAKSTKISVTCKANEPTKDVPLLNGEYVERKRYKIIGSYHSDVIPVIWDALGQSYLETNIRIVYKEIIYNTNGDFWGYGSSQTFTELVTADITDCIIRTKYKLNK